MSETPTTPVVDPRTDQTNEHDFSQREQEFSPEAQRNVRFANETMRRYESGAVDRDFAAWERGFDTESRLDLETDDVINPNVWTEKTSATYEIPAQAEAPKTRAQEIEESLFYLDDRQLLEYARKHSAVVAHGLRPLSKRSDYSLAA